MNQAMRSTIQRLLGAALCLTALAGCTEEARQTPLTRATIIPQDPPEAAYGRTEEFDYEPPAAGSYTLPVIQEAADGEVLGPDGRERSLERVLEGQISVLSFIYTRCADPTACPRASGMLRELQRFSREDPVLAENVRLVTLSFDPEHDTPEVMKSYGGALDGKGGADWRFLTTRGRGELEPILENYDQLVEKKPRANDSYGPLYHPVRVYLIDRKGRIRNIYSWGLLDPRLVATDIRTLLLEELAEPGSESGPVADLLTLERSGS